MTDTANRILWTIVGLLLTLVGVAGLLAYTGVLPRLTGGTTLLNPTLLGWWHDADGWNIWVAVALGVVLALLGLWLFGRQFKRRTGSRLPDVVLRDEPRRGAVDGAPNATSGGDGITALNRTRSDDGPDRSDQDVTTADPGRNRATTGSASDPARLASPAENADRSNDTGEPTAAGGPTVLDPTQPTTKRSTDEAGPGRAAGSADGSATDGTDRAGPTPSSRHSRHGLSGAEARMERDRRTRAARTSTDTTSTTEPGTTGPQSIDDSTGADIDRTGTEPAGHHHSTDTEPAGRHRSGSTGSGSNDPDTRSGAESVDATTGTDESASATSGTTVESGGRTTAESGGRSTARDTDGPTGQHNSGASDREDNGDHNDNGGTGRHNGDDVDRNGRTGSAVPGRTVVDTAALTKAFRRDLADSPKVLDADVVLTGTQDRSRAWIRLDLAPGAAVDALHDHVDRTVARLADTAGLTVTDVDVTVRPSAMPEPRVH